ncbi:MAG: hypothetical protein QOJ64_498 [Acidobacteriota bacterium]|nr:hypothetical protein [Acidobacteriota bacterium]
MRLELMNSGFAIRRLANLATRAVEQTVSLRLKRKLIVCATELERKERIELSKRVWKTRMLPITSLPREQEWNSWQDSNLQLRRSKRRTLPIELQEQRLEHRMGFAPMFAAWQAAVLGY